MRQHLLRVTLDAKAFGALIDAIRKAGERVGWLELGADFLEQDSGKPQPLGLETGLGQAADLGVLRAVTVTGKRSIIVKPRRGAPVMKDLLREHFRGCILVLIRGQLTGPGQMLDPEPPRLEPQGPGWLLQVDGEPTRELNSESLIKALRKPRLLETKHDKHK